MQASSLRDDSSEIPTWVPSRAARPPRDSGAQCQQAQKVKIFEWQFLAAEGNYLQRVIWVRARFRGFSFIVIACSGMGSCTESKRLVESQDEKNPCFGERPPTCCRILVYTCGTNRDG